MSPRERVTLDPYGESHVLRLTERLKNFMMASTQPPIVGGKRGVERVN